MKVKFFLIALLLSNTTLASEPLPLGALGGLKNAPEIGTIYRIDDAAYGAKPVQLRCMSKGLYFDFSACELEANISNLFLDMTPDNFTGRNVSGMNIKFTGIKHGQLFFELLN